MGQILATVKDFFEFAGILDGILREGSKKSITNPLEKDNFCSEQVLNTCPKVSCHLTKIKREKQEASNDSSRNVLRKNAEGENKLTDAGSPRVLNAKAKTKKKDIWIKHYCSAQKILLVGEGDFSFAASLANAFGSAANMVATSLDSIGFLARNYGNAMSNIEELKNKGCIVVHDFDATEMADYQFLHASSFDRIIYNFPLAGFFGDKTREQQLKINQNLVRLFMVNARKLLKENGEIHIAHKSHGFYLEWNLEKLGRNNGLLLIDDVTFELKDYPGYNTKYGFGGDNNFDCNPSRTYMFRLKTLSRS